MEKFDESTVESAISIEKKIMAIFFKVFFFLKKSTNSYKRVLLVRRRADVSNDRRQPVSKCLRMSVSTRVSIHKFAKIGKIEVMSCLK